MDRFVGRTWASPVSGGGGKVWECHLAKGCRWALGTFPDPRAARPEGKCAPFTWWLVAAAGAGSRLPGTTLPNKATLCWQGGSDMLKAPQIANVPLAEWHQKMWMWIWLRFSLPLRSFWGFLQSAGLNFFPVVIHVFAARLEVSLPASWTLFLDLLTFTISAWAGEIIHEYMLTFLNQFALASTTPV